MSMLLSIYFLLFLIFRNGIDITQCAPKLGHILFDPLSHEAKLAESSKELPNDQKDRLKENLRMPIKIEEPSKKPCWGYDYNETLCKTVDDRVICGYNKNIGNISDKIISLKNGCRIRGDRLECGYFEGPFNIPRRPPAKDEEIDNDDEVLNLRYGPTRTSTTLTQLNVTLKQNNYNFNFTPSKLTQDLKITSENITKTSVLIAKTPPTISSILKTNITNNSSLLTASYTNITTISRRSKFTKSKRYCVDKSDRIFCYSIKQ